MLKYDDFVQCDLKKMKNNFSQINVYNVPKYLHAITLSYIMYFHVSLKQCNLFISLPNLCLKCIRICILYVQVFSVTTVYFKLLFRLQQYVYCSVRNIYFSYKSETMF